jgi:hypothetical protein
LACVICGKPDSPFGYEMGERWYCFEHWPDRLQGSSPPARAPVRPRGPGLCIVCGGADPSCWCCVLRLTGPRPNAPDAPKSAGYPDLQQWIQAYGGYNQIDWAAWDLAVKRAQTGEARLEAAPRCVHCGLTGDVYGDRLLRLVYVGPHERGYVHARCWPKQRQAEQGASEAPSPGQMSATKNFSSPGIADLATKADAVGERGVPLK